MFVQVKRICIEPTQKVFLRETIVGEDGRQKLGKYVTENGRKLFSEEATGKKWFKREGRIYVGNKVFRYFRQKGNWCWSLSTETVQVNDKVVTDDLGNTSVVFDELLDKLSHPVIEEFAEKTSKERRSLTCLQVLRLLGASEGTEEAIKAVLEVAAGTESGDTTLELDVLAYKLEQLDRETLEDMFVADRGNNQKALDIARNHKTSDLIRMILGVYEDSEETIEEETEFVPKFVVVDEKQTFCYFDSGFVDLTLSFDNSRIALDHCEGRGGKTFFTAYAPSQPIPYAGWLVSVPVDMGPAKIKTEKEKQPAKFKEETIKKIVGEAPKSDREIVMEYTKDGATYRLETFYNGRTMMQAVKEVNGVIESFSEAVPHNVKLEASLFVSIL
jgi:hypothetical protein